MKGVCDMEQDSRLAKLTKLILKLTYRTERTDI